MSFINWIKSIWYTPVDLEIIAKETSQQKEERIARDLYELENEYSNCDWGDVDDTVKNDYCDRAKRWINIH